jgi:hypothetical protein
MRRRKSPTFTTFIACALLVGACNAAEPSGDGPPAMEPASGSLAGRIAERLDAGSYTYVLVDEGAGDRTWVVTLGGAAPVGARVRVTRFGAGRGFRSARLGRTFDHLVFGIVRPE